MIFQRACIVFAFPLVSIGLQPARHFINIRTWNMNSGDQQEGWTLYSLCAAMGMNLIIILMINIKALPDSKLFFPECPRAAAAIFAADWDHCCCCFSSLLLWKTTSLLNKANKCRYIFMPNDHRCPPPDVPCKSEHHCNVLIYILLTSDLLHSQDISKINKQWKSLAHIHILIIQVLTISDLSPTTVPPMICSPSLVFWLIIRSLWWIIRLRLTGAVFAHTPLASLLLSNR